MKLEKCSRCDITISLHIRRAKALSLGWEMCPEYPRNSKKDFVIRWEEARRGVVTEVREKTRS